MFVYLRDQYPLLLMLHVNDLPDVVIQCSILMYADDTVLFFSSKKATLN